ncbi:MAG: tRNA (guanosine(46)-N7)-methyltransferase TrmB [Bifidobacterium crudilactis]|uniref:tRNA (guanosine(46)-N7)-methyltransferase TrmB n=1 Tax=Bifidobacterium crudilactis TaxID=327277 RepID=UPI003F9C24E9
MIEGVQPESPARAAGPESESGAHRPVLSFVRRSGRLDKRLQKAWDRYSSEYLIELNDSDTSLGVREGMRFGRNSIKRYWGNTHPLVVEVGTGQGENIAAAAAAHPELNFLALEVYDPGIAHTMLLAGKQGLTNLRIAQVNAPELFACMDGGSIAEVWTFFPDPWPKMKHHKRRIIQDSFARAVSEALVKDGLWRIATDIEDYALHVHEVLDTMNCLTNVGDVTVSLPTAHVGKGNAGEAANLPHQDFIESARFEGRVLTNFENKGIAAGRVIHDFTYRAVNDN